ncbi:hypothetical protein LTR27_004283 [Elasticomyces elasticus]|nr:hypothetical protein LTR27_004283 [Elasticomyces elasticus]
MSIRILRSEERVRRDEVAGVVEGRRGVKSGGDVRFAAGGSELPSIASHRRLEFGHATSDLHFNIIRTREEGTQPDIDEAITTNGNTKERDKNNLTSPHPPTSPPTITYAMAAREKGGRVVFIGNIPYGVSEEQICEIFGRVGTVVNFRLVYDKETQRPKGFGFLEYTDVDAAASAVRNLNDFEVMGRTLRVDYSNDNGGGAKKDGEGMGGGGGGGRAPPPAHFNLNPSGPQQTNGGGMVGGELPPMPAGQPLADGLTAPDAISRTLSAIPAPQLLDIISQMKGMSISNPAQATALLAQAPQLGYAMFQALLLCGLVDTNILGSLIQGGAPPPQAAQAPPPIQQQQQQQTVYQQPPMPPQQQQQAPPPQHQYQPPPPPQYQQPGPPQGYPPQQQPPQGYPPQHVQPGPPQGYPPQHYPAYAPAPTPPVQHQAYAPPPQQQQQQVMYPGIPPEQQAAIAQIMSLSPAAIYAMEPMARQQVMELRGRFGAPV